MTKENPVSDDPTQPTPQPVTWSAPAEPMPPATPTAPTPPGPSLDPVRPTISTPRRSSSGRWLNLLLGVAAAVAIGGVAFAVGRSTAPTASAAGFRRIPQRRRLPGRQLQPDRVGRAGSQRQRCGLFGAGGLTVEGTVQSVTGDTLTVTTANGRTVEVSLGSDTKYHQQAAGSASDVTTGSKVSVQLDLAGRRSGQRQPGRQRDGHRSRRDGFGRDGHPVIEGVG